MDLFQFREHIVAACEQFTRSFTRIRADDIRVVSAALTAAAKEQLGGRRN